MMSQHLRIEPKLEGETGVMDGPEVEDMHEKLPLSEEVLGGPLLTSRLSMQEIEVQYRPYGVQFLPQF